MTIWLKREREDHFQLEQKMSRELEILQNQLGKLLNSNKARIGFLAGMLLALLKVKTVNLAELARAFISTAEESSRYRRIQRFLKEYELSEEEIARVMKRSIASSKRLTASVLNSSHSTASSPNSGDSSRASTA
jgi:hypothetical protein